MPLTLGLRFGVLLAGLGFAWIAVNSWQAGSPAAGSLFSPRAETVVRSAHIETTRIGNGTYRHHVHVDVAWPADQAESRPLASLHPTFFDYSREAAQAILATYPVDSRQTVRVIDGLPHANRNDRFQLFHAIFMSLMSLVTTLLGLLFLAVFRQGSARKDSTGSHP